MQLQVTRGTRSPRTIVTAFREASKERADAVFVLEKSRSINSHRTQIAELAIKNRLPVMYLGRRDVEDGGLMTYGVSVTDLFRRAATYVDKILKGAKPADLPVEQPTKFEFVINLKSGQADRPDDSAERAGASGPGHKMTF